MPDGFHFVGRVCSGRGNATGHMRANIDEIKNITGEDIVDGSLNLVLRRPLMLSDGSASEFDDRSRLLWPAEIRGAPVWLYRWRQAPLHVVEVLSTVHLRGTLGLRDDDPVTVKIRKSDVAEIPAVGKLAWAFFWLGRKSWCYTNDRYYLRTQRWCRRFGATQEGTTETVRDLAVELAKAAVKRTPLLRGGAMWLKGRLDSRRRPAGAENRAYLFSREPPEAEEGAEQRALRQLRNVLNYTKVSGSAYAASRYPAGYHTIEILGQRLPGQRDPGKRLAAVPVGFRGRTVLDIGSNQGGMLFQLEGLIKWGVGIDYDARMVNAANRIKALRDARNLHFFVFDLEKEPLDLIEDFLPESRVDLVFLLSVCMWLKNWREVVDFGARISRAMLFETNGTDAQQSEQEEYLRKRYRNVSVLSEMSEDDPRQKKRKLLYCTERL